MLYHTRGIALHTTKFSETSIIARVYTERFGLQSYLVKGIRSAHSKIKPALFQPMTLLDLTVYHKEKSTLQNIREAANHYPYQTVSSDIRKSSVLLFVNELILKSIREVEPNQKMFDFLFENCKLFDGLNENLHLFPLWFIVHFSRLLGFAPAIEKARGMNVFNMKEGTFQDSRPDHDFYIEGEQCRLLKIILETSEIQASGSRLLAPGRVHPVSGIVIAEPGTRNEVTKQSEAKQRHPASYEVRNDLLEKMLLYYRLHLPGFHELRSHVVLHEVLS